MFSFKAASRIEMSDALAVGGSGFIPRAGSAPLFAETALGGVVGFAASATGSAGCAAAGGDDCCDSPHPTITTAAIVVISMCFISLQLSFDYFCIGFTN
jgi:hypothetical protein